MEYSVTLSKKLNPFLWQKIFDNNILNVLWHSLTHKRSAKIITSHFFHVIFGKLYFIASSETVLNVTGSKNSPIFLSA